MKIRDNPDKESNWSRLVTLHDGKEYEARPWLGRRTDVYGNSPACGCADLLKMNSFCVCLGRALCPTHGGPRCVGGHD